MNPNFRYLSYTEQTLGVDPDGANVPCHLRITVTKEDAIRITRLRIMQRKAILPSALISDRLLTEFIELHDAEETEVAQ